MNALTKLTAVVPLVALGCASTKPSAELVDARRNYEQANATPESRYAPDRLLEARQALDRAERAHHDAPRSFDEKSLAYIASRRAQLAVLYGKYAEDQKAQASAEQDYKAREDDLRKSAQQKADEARRQLQATQQQLGMLRDKLAGTTHELEQARTKIKDEPRGVVITLSGAVLFASGKSDLLPSAKRKLDDVAQALKNTGSDQQIIVEGYTDSQGSPDHNLRLSDERAQSVRDYLVQQGVDSSRIKAVGKGEESPVASNDTAEGRADNRRVEIVLPKASGAQQSGTSGAQQSGTSGAQQSGTFGAQQSGTSGAQSSPASGSASIQTKQP